MIPYIKNLWNPCVPELNYAMGENVDRDINVYLKTAFGLGGHCASMILKKIDQWSPKLILWFENY